ncbi:phosphotransferase [Agromyces archimandritae]|uniref:Phosphotransferase n=1 Tax=Agromyces archimandritae TaxID=2781962 RepID=A0A975FN69_9MICO|nr:phosphotransferase [Agromyces archimandritae]QTX04588.1 phosphotransferase [Agromyces archimandritae]
MTDAAAPTAANRVPWAALPDAVRTAVEERAGSPVVSAGLAAGGFSAGYAGVLDFADGTRRFVKAGDGGRNAETARLHRTEGRLAGELPPGFAPAFEWMLETGEWVVLAFEAVDGRVPGPWTLAELDAVLALQAELASLPAPSGLPSVGAWFAAGPRGWRELGSTAPDAVPGWARGRLDELIALEPQAVDAAAGTSFVHFDLRSDNVLLEPSGAVRLVDWPHSGCGAPWLDLAFFAPSVAVDGVADAPGIDAEAVFRRSPLAGDVDRGRLAAVMCAWAGRQLSSSLREDPPGVPGLRAFQRRQAVPVLAWASDLLDQTA